MKKLFLIIFAGALTFNVNGQPPMYDDLLIYFADGDYVKLVSKAEKYMSDSDTKSDPLVYLYASKGNFEMSKDQKYEEDFPKAYNDAIKNAGKALKNDKDGSVFDEHKKYFTELKEAVVEELRNMVDVGDYSRMRGTIIKVQRLDPTDVGSQYLMAAAKYNLKDKSGGKEALKEAEAALAEVTSVEDWREVDLLMLRMGVLEYSKYLIDARQPDGAKTLLGKVKQWFEEDEIFMEFYNEYVN